MKLGRERRKAVQQQPAPQPPARPAVAPTHDQPRADELQRRVRPKIADVPVIIDINPRPVKRRRVSRGNSLLSMLFSA